MSEEQKNELAPEKMGKTVIASGHPRSGTSLVCQLLESAGVNFLSDIGSDIYNKEGYFEYSLEKELSKRLIEQAMTDENTRDLNKIVKLLNKNDGWSGLKIVLTPAIFFYRHIGRKNLKAVFIFRNPADSKASMLRRGISQFKLSWFDNNNAIIAAHENIKNSIVISYETLMEKKPCIINAFKKIGFNIDLNRIKKIYRTQKNSGIIVTKDEMKVYKKLKELEKKSCR
jgi:hypothetical protein